MHIGNFERVLKKKKYDSVILIFISIVIEVPIFSGI